MSSDTLEYFYGITPERLNAMKNTPPPKSTDEAWKEHYRLQEEYIEELEAENARLNQRIKRLEEAGDAMDKTAEPFVLDTIDEDIPMSNVCEQHEIIYDSPPTAGDHVAMDRARKDWRKAKEAKP